MYLRKHLETFGQVTLTLNRLLEECGYSTKSHNKSIYSDFRQSIKTEIINKGYATCYVDIFTVNPTEMFSLQLSDKKNITENFFLFFFFLFFINKYTTLLTQKIIFNLSFIIKTKISK